MSSGLRRGEIYRVRQPQHSDPKKSRCFAVVSRQDLLDSKPIAFCARQLTSRASACRPKCKSGSTRA